MDAVDDVVGIEAEAEEGRSGEAGLIALVADEDDARIEAGELWVAVLPLRVEAPLEDVAVDDGGAGDEAVAPALLQWADVDQEAACRCGRMGFGGGEAIDL